MSNEPNEVVGQAREAASGEVTQADREELSERDWLLRLKHRSDRLLRLTDLSAPPVIIEKEKELVAKAWAKIAATTDIQARLDKAEAGLTEVRRLLHRIDRTGEMSANLMRDNRRTGGWEGAEKTARQFDWLSKYAKAAKTHLDQLTKGDA